MNLGDRIQQLRQIAIDAGVDGEVGEFPGEPELLASAYAVALGLDQFLVLDPTISLEDVANFSRGGTA